MITKEFTQGHRKAITYNQCTTKKNNYHSLGYVTRVVYLCSSLLQLAAVSRDLSQAEIEITVCKPE